MHRRFTDDLYLCFAMHFIVSHHVCDGSADCPHGDDEAKCTHMCSLGNSYQCLTSCHHDNCSCGSHYFQCPHGGCIPLSKICDCNPDCVHGSDEDSMLCSYSMCNQSVFARIFNQTEKISDSSILSLAQVCSSVNYHYMCSNHSLTYTLFCPVENIYVQFKFLGNNKTYCSVSYDDEIVALFNKRRHMTEGCTVVGFSVVCHKSERLPQFNEWTRTLTITNLQPIRGQTATLVLKQSVRNMRYAVVLHVSHTPLHFVDCDIFSSLQHLTRLTLTNNHIHSSCRGAFRFMKHLYYFDMRNNRLPSLDRNLTQSLISLAIFHLSNNDITSISSHTFDDLYLLEVLNLTGNPVSFTHININSESFYNSLNAILVLADRYETCCFFDLSDKVSCRHTVMRTDTIGSCSRILSLEYLKWWSCFAGLSTMFINLMSLVCWTKAPIISAAPKLLGASLSLSDGLVALLMFTLFITDTSTVNNVRFLIAWKESQLCSALGHILMLCTQTSNFTTLLLAVDRLFSIVIHPFRKEGITGIQATFCLAGMWLFTLTLMFIHGFVNTTGMQNSACIIIGSSMSLYLSAIILVSNFMVFASIAVCYALLWHAVYNVSKINPSNNKNVKLIVKLGSTVFTNLIAWLTVSVILFLVYAQAPVPPSTEAILSIVMYTCNALINPFLNNSWMQCFR